MAYWPLLRWSLPVSPYLCMGRHFPIQHASLIDSYKAAQGLGALAFLGVGLIGIKMTNRGSVPINDQ